MSIGKLFSKFFSSDKDDKALVTANTEVSSNHSEKQVAGAGQTHKISNKGSLSINNSTTNNYNYTINLNSESFSDDDKKRLLDEFNNGNVQFVAQNSVSEIEDCIQREKDSGQTELIEYFKDKINSFDLQCLRTGLYVSSLLATGQKKKAAGIRERAASRSRRARNIINMASAGYFGTYIRPIFENSPLEKASAEYEEAVKYMPEMIFVNSGMTDGHVVNAIEEKIRKKEKYHLQVKKIIVNGLGSCVETIQKVEAILSKSHPEYEAGLEIKTSGNIRQGKLTITL